MPRPCAVEIHAGGRAQKNLGWSEKQTHVLRLMGWHWTRPVGKKTLRLLRVLGVSAVSQFLAGIPPPRRRVRKGYAENNHFFDKHVRAMNFSLLME